MKNKNIIDFIVDEYLFKTDELVDYSSFIKSLDTLTDNRLATKIAATYDTVNGSSFTLFNFACMKLCKLNKYNKKFIDKGNYSEYDSNIGTKVAGCNAELKEYIAYNLPIGIYTAEIKSKHKDEFMVLSVNSSGSDTSYLNYSIYFIGRKCFKHKEEFMNEFKKLKMKLGEEITDRIKFIDNRAEKETIFKPFDKMVFTNKQKYIDYIDNWVNSLPIYYEYGIIPKLSILLYGDPGTGKSTFCKALAKHLDISSITSIPPQFFTNNSVDSERRNRKIKASNVTESFLKRECQTVYSIDDIDCITVSRDKDKSSQNGMIMASLLEFLDNPPTFYMKGNDGKYYQVAIVCATTNYYDRLDPAIKRHGRFDLTIELKRFTVEEAEEMCKIYNLSLKDIYPEKFDRKSTFSPAQIQALCMENIDRNLKNNN